MNVGIRIKQLREEIGLSNRQLALLCGLSQPVMHRLENNERSADIETLEKICKAMNLTLSEFFKDDNPQVSPELTELLTNAKTLTPEQLRQLTKFIKTMK